SDEHDRAPVEEEPQSAPLGRTVHQRWDVQTDERCLVLGSFAGELVTVDDAFVRVGVDPTTESEKDVLMSPDDTFGHTGRAPGVDHVEVIATAVENGPLR